MNEEKNISADQKNVSEFSFTAKSESGQVVVRLVPRQEEQEIVLYYKKTDAYKDFINDNYHFKLSGWTSIALFSVWIELAEELEHFDLDRLSLRDMAIQLNHWFFNSD